MSNSIGVDTIIEKRKNQLAALEQLGSNIQQAQNSLNQLTEQYSINRGALLQLNDILEDMGVDVSSLDQDPDEDTTAVSDGVPISDDGALEMVEESVTEEETSGLW